MSEDEAFIRAIVDNPGEDTARLVYADWLDDRDDPRGTYLRAEYEAVENGDIERLRRLSAGLDPVWVARVSRPPMGVCCDSLRFEPMADRTGTNEIEEYEQRIQATLPPEYRAFLLNYNGGSPTPHDFKTRDYPESPDWLTLGRFEPLISPAKAKVLSPKEPIQYGLDWNFAFVLHLAEGSESIIEGLLPIADTDFDLGYLFLSLRPESRGRIYHFPDFCHRSDNAEWLIEVAASLPSLFNLVGRSAEFGAIHER